MLARKQVAGLNSENRALSRRAANTLFEISAELGARPSGLPGAVLDDSRWAGLAAPDHPTLRALIGALLCGGPGAAAAGWRKAEGCAQVTLRMGLTPIRVRLRAADAAASWGELQAISPLALDVVMVLVDRFQAEGTEVRLTRCAEILAAKGCRRWGDERHALEEQIGRELMRLGCLSVGDDEPLISVTPVGAGGADFVVSLLPGVKAQWDSAPTRRLNQALLEFDHRLNRGADVLAKKLGLYLSLAGAESRPVARRVGAVLTAIGQAQDLACGARGGRLADRFEEAVLRLQERGLFAVSYRGGGDPLGEDARVKGWVRRWLGAELIARPC